MPIAVRSFGTLREAAAALTSEREAVYLGGGTLIMRAVNEGGTAFATILRSTDPSLLEIRSAGERIVLGAGVTMAAIMAARETAFLAPAARAVGGPAVRTMATVGGNLFAPHPYGDLATALLALDATVTLAGAGQRELPLDELLRGRERGAPELVASISMARPRDPQAFRFLKVARVKPKGVSVLSIAAHLPSQGGRLAGVRVAYGAMAPTPVRALAVERALEGRALDGAAIAAAVAAATEGLDPPTDALASSWYRTAVAPVHLRRLLEGSTR